MKKANLFILSVISVLPLLSSCIRGEVFEDTEEDNFKALWTIIDEHYCFFDYKEKEIDLDWNTVYTKYHNRLSSNMDNAQLFEVLSEMLSELKDGHVNLYAAHDVGRNWSWYENYPSNFNDSIHKLYLGTDYKIASSLKYKILEDNIGYIYCGSFNSALGDGNISQALSYLAECSGLIIDVRENSGGELTNAEKLASRFTNERILVGYMSHKTGPGHNEFSTLEEIWLEPSKGIRWQKDVIVLTNRRCYSATNDFIKDMRQCPKVTIIGDQTGGGSGMPFSSELPNGWSIRFSACPIYDVDKNHTEFGIKPDISINMTKEDILKNRDTIIEFARNFLKK
ncbi:MAG: S41 family peptidase [Bacteroidaceae bacterium]|nr:S41 family peptidase [Bacteroidaceae bacterium]